MFSKIKYLFKNIFHPKPRDIQNQLCIERINNIDKLIACINYIYQSDIDSINMQDVYLLYQKCLKLLSEYDTLSKLEIKKAHELSNYRIKRAALKDLFEKLPEKVSDFIKDKKFEQIMSKINSDEFKNLEASQMINTIDNFRRQLLAIGGDVERLNSCILDQMTKTAFYAINSEDFLSLDEQSMIDLINKLRNSLIAVGADTIRFDKRVKEQKINRAYKIIGSVEGHLLDSQQMECIVEDAHSQLVLAGAGTGKTTTIVGYIKYLLKTQKCNKDEILVLSFTDASAAEMRERIMNETKCNIAASTFHKLGMNIITDVEHKKPTITGIDMRKFIKSEIIKNMANPKYFRQIFMYILFSKANEKSEFDFASAEEYQNYCRLNPPTTLKGEVLKSYGEVDIANFLKMNGINYIYEEPYKVDTSNETHSQYKPDFYLPDYDIYIEYFGVNSFGEVPSYFSASPGMTPSEEYRGKMEWKRKTHEQNGTKMIECFFYEKQNGNLLENLSENLLANSVVFNPCPVEELWNSVEDSDDVLSSVAELFGTIINLIKSNNYTLNDVELLNKNSPDKGRNSLIINLLRPIFNEYNNVLKLRKEIDFNDMINIASRYVKDGRYEVKYKYVIIDEYQDISKARYNLVNSMRSVFDFNLFCVGDDWQSIYRFAGSDIGYILDFKKYWGLSVIGNIGTTYRFNSGLIRVSSLFITQNPHQLKKTIIGNGNAVNCPLGEIVGYKREHAVDYIIDKLDDLPQDSSIFFIGRYKNDVKMLDKHNSIVCKYNNESGLIDVVYIKRPDLKMHFLTAHKSKGLQADYVIIVNNKDDELGFPSRIQDSSIISLLLESSDDYPYAEERRLYYVALTRAKKKVFFYVDNNNVSTFARELEHRHKEELKREKYECPICGGQLILIHGPYSDFFGCSNYKTNNCRYKRQIKHY